MAGKPKKGGLGRGLDALIADTVPVVKEKKEREQKEKKNDKNRRMYFVSVL